MAEHHVLGISGGKDSAALAVYMSQMHPELDIQYFFTDTGKELPEVYEFLGRLEGLLGKPITQLNPHRGFDYWLKAFNNFLPSPQTRWCTRVLKLEPFRAWIKPWLDAGDTVYSYVAIRADEEHRTGMRETKPGMKVVMPFREAGIDKAGVYEILESSGLGLPAYYEWRSRSGCTFCFFQQKIEWVELLEHHPDRFMEAMAYEKTAVEHGSPFTWSQGESLEELSRPERVAQIRSDFEKRRSNKQKTIRINPLREGRWPQLEIDDIYDLDEGNGACSICVK